MDELSIYQGTHSGGEIDRDLDCIDAAYNLKADTAPDVRHRWTASIPAIDFDSETSSPLKVYFYHDQYTDSNGIMVSRGVRDLISQTRIIVNFSSISSLPITVQVPYLTGSYFLLHSELSNPSAQIGPWTVETGYDENLGSGTVSISGSISGTTSLKLVFAWTQQINNN